MEGQSGGGPLRPVRRELEGDCTRQGALASSHIGSQDPTTGRWYCIYVLWWQEAKGVAEILYSSDSKTFCHKLDETPWRLRYHCIYLITAPIINYRNVGVMAFICEFS